MKFYQNQKKNHIMIDMVINNLHQLQIVDNSTNNNRMISMILIHNFKVFQMLSEMVLNKNSISNNHLGFLNLTECQIWISFFLETILIPLKFSKISSKTIHFLIKISMIQMEKAMLWRWIHLKMTSMMISSNLFTMIHRTWREGRFIKLSKPRLLLCNV